MPRLAEELPRLWGVVSISTTEEVIGGSIGPRRIRIIRSCLQKIVEVARSAKLDIFH